MNDALHQQSSTETERILFLTGRLAEPSVQKVVAELSEKIGFQYEIEVLGVSVAALMHVGIVKRRLNPEHASQFHRIILPGWCSGDIDELTQQFQVPFQKGPKNIFDLPQSMGRKNQAGIDLSQCDIEILAEINHAPQLSESEILDMANGYRESGANLIDVGCLPGYSWNNIGKVVTLLKKEGHRIAVDSFDRQEVTAAVDAGAELVLSCNGTNVSWAKQLNAEVVAIPDTPSDIESLQKTIDLLNEAKTHFRIDPILEPIGFGFAASLNRYFNARKRWPNYEIMMGIGNVTELVEADSSGINMLLAGICQELEIRSVLTTEVIHWAQSAVKEFDIARRMAHFSIQQNRLAKHLDSGLVTLRDGKQQTLGKKVLDHLAKNIQDPNFRIFAEEKKIHIINRDGHWAGNDPYQLFDQLLEEANVDINARYGFYLGNELAKAKTALTLGKQYTQDQALRWGFLTVEEESAIERRANEQNDSLGETS